MQWFDEEEEERRRKGLLEGAISMPQEDLGVAPSERLGRAITPPQAQQSQPPAKLAQVVSAAKQVPSPALSSTGEPNSNGLLSNAIKDDSDATVNEGTLPLLGGGNLTNEWHDVETAQKELGSFSNSAGKWWSVLLAAMFPQYGSALNMIGGMKESKYRAARDKYDMAFKRATRTPHQIEVDGGVWDVEKQQFAPGAERRQRPGGLGEVMNLYAEPPGGVVVKQVKRGESYDPYYTTEGAAYQGPTPQGPPVDAKAEGEKYPYYSEDLYGTILDRRSKEKIAAENLTGREENLDKQFQNQAALTQLRTSLQERATEKAIRLRADLRDDLPSVMRATLAAYDNDVDFLTSAGGKGLDMVIDKAIKKTDEIKANRRAGNAPGEVVKSSGSGSSSTNTERVLKLP